MLVRLQVVANVLTDTQTGFIRFLPQDFDDFFSDYKPLHPRIQQYLNLLNLTAFK